MMVIPTRVEPATRHATPKVKEERAVMGFCVLSWRSATMATLSPGIIASLIVGG